KVLNSLDFGVPQMRERIYFVGVKKELIDDDFSY
ncbi:DNA (cytosine-5-)-methyltransferase, partial [Sulfurovum sp. bin170]